MQGRNLPYPFLRGQPLKVCRKSDNRSRDEWLSLKETKKVKKSSHVIKLDPVLMEGILCVGNRLQNSPLQDKRKHPAIIPKDNHISKLIARYYHSTKGHSGLRHTLSLIREKFWIIQARSLQDLKVFKA